jgi:hypothetical protein
MDESVPKAELMRSLGRLIRGLSALFWGLPITLLVCAKSDVYTWFRPYGIVLPAIANGLLFYGLTQMAHFQRQERIWTAAIERTKLLGLINIGLSPFLFFWFKAPKTPFFTNVVCLLVISGLLFLFNLNYVLNRLSAMLPDQTLREETKLFTELNRHLLVGVLILLATYYLILRLDSPPLLVFQLIMVLNHAREWLLILLVLLPVAMTMTLIWKIKDVVLASVFDQPD